MPRSQAESSGSKQLCSTSDKGLYKSDAQGNPDPSGDEIWSSATYSKKTVNFTKSWDFCVNHVGKEKLEAEAFSAAHEACGT